MQEGSPPDPAPESEAPEATEQPTAPTEEQANGAVAEEARTPEEVEAIWKNRVAGKDRAHAESERVLREELAAERRKREALEQTARQSGEAATTDADQWKTRAEAAEADLASERQGRLVDVRSAKYAAAAETLSPEELASIDEARLAALNARLQGDEAPAAPPVDPNTPRRPAPGTATPTPRERGVAELESDLKKYEPEFRARLEGE